MKYGFVLITICASLGDCYGQMNSASAGMELAINHLEKNSRFIRDQSSNGTVIGDQFLTAHWDKTDLYLFEYENVIKGFYTKYDLERNTLYLKVGEFVKYIDGTNIEKFILSDSLNRTVREFRNAKTFYLNDAPLIGFVEIVVDGPMILLAKTRIDVLKPDFNIALNSGSKDFKILKKRAIYYSVKFVCYEIQKKTLTKAFGDLQQEILSYTEKEKLKFRKERDLIKIVQYYNSVISKAE